MNNKELGFEGAEVSLKMGNRSSWIKMLPVFFLHFHDMNNRFLEFIQRGTKLCLPEVSQNSNKQFFDFLNRD